MNDSGDEEEYQVWWKALLARHGLYGSSDSLCAVGLASLLTSACRLLRDSFAPSSYLRNLRTVRFGAHRLGDRYEDFRLVSSTRLGRSYRCRGRLSYEDRHCSQIRKDRIACPSDQLRAEAELVRAMQHPNLHRVVESFEDRCGGLLLVAARAARTSTASTSSANWWTRYGCWPSWAVPARSRRAG